MYHSPTMLEYEAAYRQEEALRQAADHRLASQVDKHTSAEHQLVAALVALLLVIAVIVVL